MMQISDHKAAQKAALARKAAERAARRKAELKANMGRRKAQLRARADMPNGVETAENNLGDDAPDTMNEAE